MEGVEGRYDPHLSWNGDQNWFTISYAIGQTKPVENVEAVPKLLNANNRHTNGQHDQGFNHGTNGHSFCEGGPSYHEGNSLGDGSYPDN